MDDRLFYTILRDVLRDGLDSVGHRCLLPATRGEGAAWQTLLAREDESDGDGGASAEEEGEMGDDREEEGGEADAAKEGVPHSQSLPTRRLKRPHAPTSTRMPATKGKRGVAQGPACTGATASRVAHDSSDDEGLAPAKAAAVCSSQPGSRDKEAGTTTVATHQSEKVCIQLRARGRGDGGDGGVLRPSACVRCGF